MIQIGRNPDTQSVLPAHLEQLVITAIRTYEPQLHQGAVVTVDESRGRVRIMRLHKECAGGSVAAETLP
jgi:hypothetical protein